MDTVTTLTLPMRKRASRSCAADSVVHLTNVRRQVCLSPKPMLLLPFTHCLHGTVASESTRPSWVPTQCVRRDGMTLVGGTQGSSSSSAMSLVTHKHPGCFFILFCKLPRYIKLAPCHKGARATSPDSPEENMFQILGVD